MSFVKFLVSAFLSRKVYDSESSFLLSPKRSLFPSNFYYVLRDSSIVSGSPFSHLWILCLWSLWRSIPLVICPTLSRPGDDGKIYVVLRFRHCILSLPLQGSVTETDGTQRHVLWVTKDTRDLFYFVRFSFLFVSHLLGSWVSLVPDRLQKAFPGLSFIKSETSCMSETTFMSVDDNILLLTVGIGCSIYRPKSGVVDPKGTYDIKWLGTIPLEFLVSFSLETELSYILVMLGHYRSGATRSCVLWSVDIGSPVVTPVSVVCLVFLEGESSTLVPLSRDKGPGRTLSFSFLTPEWISFCKECTLYLKFNWLLNQLTLT